MKNHKHTCDLCGQSVSYHIHRFTKSLATLMLKAVMLFVPGEPFHLQHDFLSLTHNQYNNFQKLKYWNLVEKFVIGGKHKAGHWFFTSKADEFVTYGHAIPKWVKTFNNQVIEISSEKITLKEAFGHYDLPMAWEKRAQNYLADRGQLSLFPAECPVGVNNLNQKGSD